ncbi:MAG: RagB/SusD family nutrient uptake outer membrane protein [Gemmatimonadetes bacterium]|nr:RagB/SusD family nutrient uptake outer membrane protein [Gemmatimonadota bacterium]
MTTIAQRYRVTRMIGSLAAATAMLVMVGCKDLDVVNLNGASASSLETAPTPAQLVTAAQSLVTQWRGIDAGHASELTKYGYEMWSFRASEPRGLTNVVTGPITGGNWSFGTIKNINLFLAAINNVTGMTDAEKAGLRGWLKMNLAIQYEDMAQAHDSFGVVLVLQADPLNGAPAPINTKAQVWTEIFRLMDEAYTTDLPAAGATFPNLKISAGFAGYNTPVTMRPLNRALVARWRNIVAVPFGRPGYNAADWTAVQTALGLSFISPSTVAGAPTTGMTAAQMRAGPFHVYEASSTNGLNSVDRFSVWRFGFEAQCKTTGAIPGASCGADSVLTSTTAVTYTPTNRDGRAFGANARVMYVGTASALNLFNVTSNARQTDMLAPTQTARIGTLASLPVIRNEELLLIRAETYLNANPPDCANAILDINRVRTSAIAAMPALTCPYVAVAALNQPATLEDELLYEKRFSLWAENGTVWLDMRHYGKAKLIPHWLPEFRIFDIFPIPAAECDIRGYSTKGCFQGGYGGIQGGPNTKFQPLN